MSPTTDDEMEQAYQAVDIDRDTVEYILSHIQKGTLDVSNIRDFFKGFLVQSFVRNLTTIRSQNGTINGEHNEISYQEYLKKVTSSEKLKKILDEIL